MASERVPVMDNRSSRIALLAVAASLAAVLFIVAVNAVFLLNGRFGAAAFSLVATLLIVNLTLVGGLLAVRRASNSIGWLLLGAGVLAAASFAAGYYADLDDFVGRGRLPFVDPIAWIGAWVFVPAIGLTVALLPMLFPTGRLPGPHWRLPVAVMVVALSMGTIATATAPGPLQNADWIANPIVLPAPLLDQVQAIGVASNLLALPIFVIAVGGLIARFRRSNGPERQQYKWFLFVASFAAVALGISIPFHGPIPDAAWLVGLVAIACLPLAFAIAILRYRLYEIDRIVSRTIGWATVSLILGTVFVGVVLLAQATLASVTNSSTLAVAASTLVTAALVQPLRQRVQLRVDRRFYRSRYDAERTVAVFTDRLRDEVDLDRLGSLVVATVDQAVKPTSLSFWLRG